MPCTLDRIGVPAASIQMRRLENLKWKHENLERFENGEAQLWEFRRDGEAHPINSHAHNSIINISNTHDLCGRGLTKWTYRTCYFQIMKTNPHSKVTDPKMVTNCTPTQYILKLSRTWIWCRYQAQRKPPTVSLTRHIACLAMIFEIRLLQSAAKKPTKLTLLNANSCNQNFVIVAQVKITTTINQGHPIADTEHRGLRIHSNIIKTPTALIWVIAFAIHSIIFQKPTVLIQVIAFANDNRRW